MQFNKKKIKMKMKAMMKSLKKTMRMEMKMETRMIKVNEILIYVSDVAINKMHYIRNQV